MLDKKEISKAIDTIIVYHAIKDVRINNLAFNELLKSIAALSNSIDNGHFDVKEPKDE